ncbi:MAG TPA: hypothetical protein VGS97_19790 [Actinocrinis sp.]|uniref:hypothetical protein n=1 Tax=Actinocrinis sp. TaxID=1920516 RepID=UPI002DDD3EB8|nr:hypothetical protein [Actinocrinis sp.]HEV2346352.1 hypothetical protein [Actinocrinis sp.]
MITLPPVGSIGLVKVRGIVGEAIGAAEWLADKIDRKTFTDYEHAFVLTSVGDPADPLAQARVAEAEPGGVRVSYLNEYHGRDVLWIPCPPQYGTAMVHYALSYVGVGYSDLDYVAIAAHVLGLDPFQFGRDIVDHTGHVVCSMMAVAAAQRSGWPLVAPSEFAGYFTPDDLAKYAPAGAVPQLIA